MKIKLGKSIVEYSPETGEFKWVLAYRKPFMTGKLAEKAMSNGYLYIKANGRMHSCSRLAFNIMNGGIDPTKEIDHIDGNNQNNRPENLREVTRSQNMMNTILAPNKIGIRGVSLHRQSGLFRARFRDKTTYHTTAEEARAGYATLVANTLED